MSLRSSAGRSRKESVIDVGEREVVEEKGSIVESTMAGDLNWSMKAAKM